MRHVIDAEGQVEIGGRIYNVGFNAESDFHYLEAVALLCEACGENDVDELDGFCPTCVMEAMRVATALDLLNRVVENDPRIFKVMQRDEATAREMARIGNQYISLVDAGYDEVAGSQEDFIENFAAPLGDTIRRAYRNRFA